MMKISLKKYSLYTLSIVIALELCLRLLGYSSAKTFPTLIKDITPSDAIIGDSLVGFKFKGNSSIVYRYEKNYSFSANHDPDGTRSCDLDSSDAEIKVDFYGGSLFYGFGLNDTSVFTSRLANSLKGFRIKNNAIFGHSLTTSYLQLKDQIERGELPDIAIMTYATYNLPRNVYAWEFRRNLFGNSDNLNEKGIKYPYARLKSQNDLSILYDEFGYSPTFLSKYSAIACTIEHGFEERTDKKLNFEKVDRILIQKINDLCISNKIELVFAIISSPSNTASVRGFLKNQNIKFLKNFVDYEDPKYNLMPYDNHPNDLAHKIYAKNFQVYLESRKYR